MKLERWSWIAGIVTAIVGFMAWLIDRNDFISFCKTSGKIVGTPFLMAWHWLVHPVTWPVWGLVFVGLFGLFIPLLFFIFANLIRRQPIAPDPSHYRTDEIFGVIWQWDYVLGKLHSEYVVAFCPQQGCMCRLEHRPVEYPKRGRGNQFADDFPVCVFCPKCGFKKDFDWNWQHLSHNVLVEVERRINTGEFKGAFQA